ncbi:MAG: fused response regulator/phosphatase [Gammaproteobacteria bacterium]|nr:fused response regulator/phosphatase [Gammaproteobacteria bacterium]
MSDKQVIKKQIALIADDDITNRMVLAKFLEKLGYTVIQAENGKQAIECYIQHSPDIIFMDVMMPEMNGYEATTQIKYLCKSNFVPVIFLTALNDANDLAKCVAAGGDDFLSKPLEMTILRAKIHAIERIRNLYRQVQNLNSTLKSADEISNKVFEQAVFTKNVKIDSIETWFKASKQFNNDLFLVAHTPSNGINILFGHFNVQGLASAVGALPASEVFRSMSKKGFAPHSIVQRINSKLYDLLPNGITLSMVFINIDENMNQALVCNFNMPEVQFIDESKGEIHFQKPPQNDAIGETPRYSRDVELERVAINENTRIILGSSGIYGCKNDNGEHYTQQKYLNAIKNGITNGNILNTLKHDILQFSDINACDNNISIIEIPCTKELISSRNALENEIQSKKILKPLPRSMVSSNQIQFSLYVAGRCMRTIDPVPTLLNNLESVTNIEKHQEAIFTVLTELYFNALDHGVLKLDSKLKISEDGFNEYYHLRDEKLRELNDGHIHVKLSIELNEEINRLSITVEDSGDGFDSSLANSANNNIFSGRGLKLIKGLCEQVSFNETGNQVEAIYSWN